MEEHGKTNGTALELVARRSAVFKALGHPSRLRMVEALAAGELCVCELRALIGDDMSTVSKHLRLLKEAGLIVDDKRGVQVFYRLRLPCVVAFFNCVDDVLRAPPSRVAGCEKSACRPAQEPVQKNLLNRE